MALACGNLKQGFSLPARDWGWVMWWEHQILAARPMVSNKVLALWLCIKRIPTKTESSETSKVFIRRKKVQYLWRNTQEDSQESPWVVPKWQWKLLIWGISSSFPLANHSDLPGSQSVFGISQDPLLCVHASLSQDGFYWKAVWVEHPLSSLSFGLQGNFLYMCGQGGLLTLIMRNMGSGWGPASLP